MTYIMLLPPTFLDNCILLHKRIDGKKTWKSQDGKRLYQWDSRHGDVEVYNAKSGYHMGSADKVTGIIYKEPDKERRLPDV